MAHPYAEHRAHHAAKARKVVHGAGYKNGGHVDEAEDRRMVTKAVHEHEDHEHGGEHTKLKLRKGGHVEGDRAKHHLAKRARGGHVGKHKGATHVTVNVAPQHGGGMAGGLPTAQPAALPPHPPAMAPPAAPPMGAPPMGAPHPALPPAGGAPGMGMPAARPPMPMPGGMPRARGGHVPHLDGGAGGGKGRIEKAQQYGERGDAPSMPRKKK